jgi:hypothetical protein
MVGDTIPRRWVRIARSADCGAPRLLRGAHLRVRGDCL